MLGTGASGDVREAVSRRSGRAVAVKSFKIAELKPKQRGNLVREVSCHSAVEHPNVAKLEAVYETPQDVVLVVERLDGGELFARMVADDRMNECSSAVIITQVLRALAFLHSHGIVHRDVKPENIMFEEQGGEAVKLIDFGFSCFRGSEDARRQMCGTVQYVAPEILQRKGFGSKSDVWSAGAVLYTMLTGRVMYGGDDTQVLMKNKAGAVDYSRPFVQLSEDCQRFVRRLLTVDTNARPAAAEALEDPWLRQHAPTFVELALEEVRRDEELDGEDLAPRPRWELRMEAVAPLQLSPMRLPAAAPQGPKKFAGFLSMLLPYLVGPCVQADDRVKAAKSGWAFLPNFAGLFKDLALCAHSDARRS